MACEINGKKLCLVYCCAVLTKCVSGVFELETN